MNQNRHVFKTYPILVIMVVLLAVNPICQCQARKRACVCMWKYGLQSDFCSRVKQDANEEVLVVHEGKSNYKNWQWDTITAVLSTSDAYNTELMCIAHSKKRQYGVIEKIPRATNTSDPVFTNFTEKLNAKFMDFDFVVDFIAFDLLDLIGDCQISDEEEASNVVALVGSVILTLKTTTVKVLCIVPYKPPCFQKDCRYFTSNVLAEYCDRIITSPESYITYCDHNCKARATVPQTKLAVGVDEYLTSGIPETKMLIGIPWHGYDYKCSSYTKKEIDKQDICEVNQVNGSDICDFGSSSRSKLTFAYLTKNYKASIERHEWSHLYKAPFFSYVKVTKGQNETHQVWFEASDSLLNKYNFAKLMGIRGVVIWTADDLSNAGPGIEKDANNEMWAWVAHSLYLSGNIPIHDISIAGKMAAVGVGCLVVGAGLGLLVACAVNKTKDIKRRKPFAGDEDDIDAYHDDDNVL